MIVSNSPQMTVAVSNDCLQDELNVRLIRNRTNNEMNGTMAGIMAYSAYFVSKLGHRASASNIIRNMFWYETVGNGEDKFVGAT